VKDELSLATKEANQSRPAIKAKLAEVTVKAKLSVPAGKAKLSEATEGRAVIGDSESRSFGAGN
jgi:hypothetical protein